MDKTKITKSVKWDSMSLSAKFKSGATLKFRLNRNGETLEVGFSNDSAELKKQSAAVMAWMKPKGKETNQDRFDRLEKTCLAVNSGKEFMETIGK